jgi:hypothetical protein
MKECVCVPDYKKMYFQLVAKVANAVDILVDAQQQGEDDYIESENLTVTLTDINSETKDDDKVYQQSN